MRRRVDMEPRLPTDDDTNQLFDDVVAELQAKYRRNEAEAFVREYYEKFTSPDFCQSIGIPLQNDDFFHHESVGGMTLRVYYYLCLKGDPSPHSYIDWRAEFFRQRRHERWPAPQSDTRS